MSRTYDACFYSGGLSVLSWSNSGTDLAASSSHDVLDVSGSGRLLHVRTHTKASNWCTRIYLDGEQVNYAHNVPYKIKDLYDCCGDFGIVQLDLYDTVNNKYMMTHNIRRFAQDFGSSCLVQAYNDAVSAIKGCVFVDSTLDSSPRWKMRGVIVVPASFREELAKELEIDKKLITVAKKCIGDMETEETWEETVVLLHSEDLKIKEALKNILGNKFGKSEIKEIEL